jgi:hypothetical protein
LDYLFDIRPHGDALFTLFERNGSLRRSRGGFDCEWFDSGYGELCGYRGLDYMGSGIGDHHFGCRSQYDFSHFSHRERGANIDYLGFDVDGITLGAEPPTIILQENLNLHAYWASANVFVAPSTGILTLRIFDIRGNCIVQEKMNVHAGNNQVFMHKPGAGLGVYWVKSEWNGISAGTFKMMVTE